MKKAIEHFKKLLTCEQFIITGSYALSILGLVDRVNDLDIVLVKPDEESMSILKKLRVEQKSNLDYPESPDQYRVKYEEIHVDFFILQSQQKCIPVVYEKQVLLLSRPVDIMEAKRRYRSLKQILQRKQIAELFYRESEIDSFIKLEQQKVRNGGMLIKSTPLPFKKEIDLEEDFDDDDYVALAIEPLRKSPPKK